MRPAAPARYSTAIADPQAMRYPALPRGSQRHLEGAFGLCSASGAPGWMSPTRASSSARSIRYIASCRSGGPMSVAAPIPTTREKVPVSGAVDPWRHPAPDRGHHDLPKRVRVSGRAGPRSDAHRRRWTGIDARHVAMQRARSDLGQRWGCKPVPAGVSSRHGQVPRDQAVTREVLYQLSYVGVRRDFPHSPRSRRAPELRESWSAAARGKGSRPSPVRMCSETITRARPPVCVLGRRGAPGAIRWARRRVFGLLTGQMETEVAQDDMLDRGTGRCERVVSAGVQGAHGGLLIVAIDEVPSATSGTAVVDNGVRLSYC